MKHLDLFSGIGGFALAARWMGWETVGFCEIDPYCQKVLAKNFPGVPIHEDIKTYDGQECDLITAGFPCQPYSQAGLQRGEADDRALWSRLREVVWNSRPAWFVGENVVGFAGLGLAKALSELAGMAYRVRTFDIPACSVGAPHARRRLWIVAHSIWDEQQWEKPRSRKTGRMGREQQSVPWDTPWESALAEFRGMDDGLSGRLVTNRADAIRNAIVPQVAYQIFKAIEHEN